MNGGTTSFLSLASLFPAQLSRPSLVQLLKELSHLEGRQGSNESSRQKSLASKADEFLWEAKVVCVGSVVKLSWIAES